MQNIHAKQTIEDNGIDLPERFEKGQVFTPKFLADWVAGLLKEQLGKSWSGRLLDPACGDGELLYAVTKKLPKAKLFGVDIDAAVTQSARLRLSKSATVKTADMILSPSLLKNTRLPSFDALISNPPWGADLLHSRAILNELGYSLASGQFDSWSLFLEKSLRMLRCDGIAAFIIPDAIFAPEHMAVRAFIAKKCSIELIARLGEGIFRNVCRGTTILLVRKQIPAANHRIEVFRLDKLRRADVLAGNLDLQEVRARSSHYINQSRFLSDTRCRWDIDVRSSDQSVMEKLEAIAGNWSDLIVSGRGVELSKKGLVKACPVCGCVVPFPTRPRSVTCVACGLITHTEDMHTQGVVVNDLDHMPGFMPLIVGEDIDRYKVSCLRQIKLGVPGINYKDHKIYSRERLLVRKTGIGLKATITKKVAASNQVVFHYVPRPKGPSFYLYYVLGVLSSRTMFAYYLRKTGECEWRSHPYVTPKTLAELPIPAPQFDTQPWRQAVEIAARVKKHLRYRGRSKRLDLEIEGLVAGIYRLDHSDLEWVKQVICDAQDLEPMRALRDFELNSIPIEMVT